MLNLNIKRLLGYIEHMPIKIIISICLCVVFFQRSAFGQVHMIPKCGGLFNQCGYIDRENEKIIIPYNYERAMPFSEGLAVVRIKGQYGYIDESGEVVIEPKFDLAGDFYQGLAEVIIKDKAGVIDDTGNLVVEPNFARAVPFTSETVLIQEGQWRNMHYEGKEKLYNLKSPYLGSGYFKLYDIPHKKIHSQSYEIHTFEDEGRGLIWAKRVGGEINDDVYGLLKADGTWKVKPRYEHVQGLSEGRAVVREGTSAVPPSGAVDEEGNLVIPTEYALLFYWNNGYGIARKGDKEGALSKDGELVGGRYYDKIQNYHKDGFIRIKDGDKWYKLDQDKNMIELEEEPTGLSKIIKSGEKAVPKASHSAILTCIGGGKIFHEKGLWGIKDTDNNVVVSPDYRAISCFNQGVAWATHDEKSMWCPIGTDGKFQEKPACRETYYPYIQTHSTPEKMNEEAYESSVLWVRAYLDYGHGKKKLPPRMIFDRYGQGSTSIIRN